MEGLCQQKPRTNMRKIVSVTQGVARMEQWRMRQPVDFEMYDNECIAIVGPNGSGKSFFVDIITGRHPLVSGNIQYDFMPSDKEYDTENIKYICFKDSYGGDNDSTYYLQQRWNQTEIDDSTTTVGQRLNSAYASCGADTPERQSLRQHIYKLFHLNQLADKYVVLLSSGELRKLSLASAIFANPQLLIIDNPYIGLDKDARELLTHLLHSLSADKGIHIMLVVNRHSDIPHFVTHVVEIKDLCVGPKLAIDKYLSQCQKEQEYPYCMAITEHEARLSQIGNKILSIPYKENDYHAHYVVRMNNVSIKYGNHTILDKLSWTVCNGEHWAVVGSNGSGKSTLLSLVCADNPQSYACDITLFDHKRGSGESIWDIKQHIGYVSPELHRAFHSNVSVEKVIASGFNNAIGIYKTPSTQQLNACRIWMDIFGISKLMGRSFLQLSSGEQRLVLLARAMVKDPELLVLDEPLHGLDHYNRQRVRNIINIYCKRHNKTLIMVSHYEDEMPSCIDHRLSLTKLNHSN